MISTLSVLQGLCNLCQEQGLLFKWGELKISGEINKNTSTSPRIVLSEN